MANKIHGMHGTPIYNTWNNMIQRCENPNYENYHNYGGRGIKVCDRWHDIKQFCADMGERPESLSINRIDNDGDYEPGNCEWATQIEQAANTRPISCGPQKQCWFRAWHKDSMAQWMSNNQRKFARKWKLNSSHVSACLRGERKQHKGWTLRRLEFGT